MYIILGYLWQYTTNPKAIIALSIFVALISSYTAMPRKVFILLLVVYFIGLISYGVFWFVQRKMHEKKGEVLAEAIERNSGAEQDNKEELQQIHQQMKDSIKLIRKSRLGDKKGNAALYELPWYMVIGNPAAGKSSAVFNSGLNFPFENSHKKMKTGSLSGTRSCDWFFSTEGVLLDTAGRYSVYTEDHSEWLGFLNLLKKNRPGTPVNGLILVVSIAELISQSPEKTLKLAKSLRARIQDLTEQLEVFAPVYLVFTKMDLVAGFAEFFECYEPEEFDQVWGATLSYSPDSSQKAVEQFEQQYNFLYDGLKSVSTTHLSRRHAQNISPGVMTFPLEFKTLKPVLKSFIGTLFEENPYQFRPVFRGFYFTSALQEGRIESPTTQQIVQEFQLSQSAESGFIPVINNTAPNHGYFLKGLFSEIILKDKYLVKQHINPVFKRRRYITFITALLTVSILLGAWIWSARNNQMLIADVQSDLEKAVQLQNSGQQSLNSQFGALLILQERLQQLDAFEKDRSVQFSLGLYQGQNLRQKLQKEYLNGIRQLILQPSQQNMATYLQQLKNNEATLKQHHVNVQIQQTESGKVQYMMPSESNPQDGYNALKAYLMLSNPQYMDAAHLGDQVTRFWRIWLEAQGQAQSAELLAKAEQILSYAMTLTTVEGFPVLESDARLVDQSRQVLLSVIQGTPARDRVYNEIKMRAAVRFPALTIGQIVGNDHKSLVMGGYALPGIFTHQAWSDYVEKAIEDAANKPIDSKDWVLNSHQSDDLTFGGSPEQIKKQLALLYKQEYILQWRKFLNAVHYAKGTDFIQQATYLNAMGEPQSSPLRSLMDRVAKETSWDNPVVQAELAVPQAGFIAWFKRKILGQNSGDLAVQRAMTQSQGVISQEFQMFYQLVRKRDDQQNKSLLDEYLLNFSQVRSKVNDLKSMGDIGPGAVVLVKQTINDQTSVFNLTEKTVSEKLSTGMNPVDQQLLQKLLVKPLTQTFESLLAPAQDEINKLWQMQAYQPFTQTISQKYPFVATATVQATSQEIGQVFGESGSISRFVKETLDPLIIRRGYTISSRTWKDMGIVLNPQFVAAFQNYVAPANGVATGELNQLNAPKSVSQSSFQFFPLQNPQLVSYTVDIDGQRMIYENGIQQWVNFIWPNPGAIPGVRITAVSVDGQTHTVVDEPGEYGINRLIDSAQRKAVNGGFEMTWTDKQNPEYAVKMNFRLISGNTGSSVGSGRGYAGLQLVDKVTVNKGVMTVTASPTPVAASVPKQETTAKSTQMTVKPS
jgi:type VI secretion system protein ImpL